MSDTPRMDAVKRMACMHSTTQNIEKALFDGGCELERELTDARRELERAKHDAAHWKAVAAYEKAGNPIHPLVAQLTAHKEVVGMCEAAIKAALHNNGGVIGFDSTTDSKEYVMVLSGDFNGLELTIAAIAKLKEGAK